MDLARQIKELVARQADELVAIRRHLHAHPELSFEEHETAEFVKSRLTEWGLAPKPIAGTGVVALIEGQHPEKKTVALRADLDALPIQEVDDRSYRSTRPGVMHACGHDVHTTSLLGAAYVLNQLRDQFEGTVKLIFQPGEEKAPGGATLVIKEGGLESPRPNAIVGQHVMPLIEAGKVGFRSGMYMASADELYVTVKGKGGHGAMPEMNIDPILIASHMVVALQQIVSRNANPKIPSVLSFGRFIAEGATNVIPNQVYLEGTFRTMDEAWRKDALQRMKKMAEGLVESMGGTCEFNIVEGYPFLKNDPDLAQTLRGYAEEYLGAENVVDLDMWMAAEDFAYYTHHVPACFYRLGTRNEARQITSSVHTPTFDIDESALPIGAGLMAWLAIRQLQP
ncbi:amidohydrolase [Catalinimonas alkaloidigena]|uniref:Amidohydrolase n=1 Tax=Catalinimonas alkaloidigena TaxID=1075417 RepID=A0A1G9DFE4_9BACT|nr:M20 family metallopeptidase [Catalinimonas alkaloidigena]SDK62552.1 amidohydrolase [Catalinimonas alkaloidigena]